MSRARSPRPSPRPASPAFFVHAAEASHGDLGMVQNGDVVHRRLVVGRDGGTGGGRHLRQALRHPADRHHRQRRQRARPRGRHSPLPAQRPGGLPERPRPDHLDDDAARARRRAGDGAARRPRASPRAISASSTPAASSAPSSPIVRDVMHRGDRIPRIRVGAKMADAIVEMSAKGFGCVGVFDDSGALVGIITDGDLRRHLKSHLHRRHAGRGGDDPLAAHRSPPTRWSPRRWRSSAARSRRCWWSRRARSSASSISTTCCAWARPSAGRRPRAKTARRNSHSCVGRRAYGKSPPFAAA